ncbi:kinase-like domain-containing protein [Tanacetum coccineum]
MCFLSGITAFKEASLMNSVVYLELWLGRNKMVGSITKEISYLSKLTLLTIHSNYLTGGIPPFLGNITSMKSFPATKNPFGGNIPDTLGHWESLSEFSCGECNLNGTIPRSMYNVSLITIFSLPDNQLTGSLPLEIGGVLPNLEFFQLGMNQLNGLLPPSIFNCSKLQIIEMHDNNLSGMLAINFEKLIDIQKIVLHDINLHGRGEVDDIKFIVSLKNCSSLRVLDFENYSFQRVLPTSIGNLSHQLSYLNLGGNNLHGNIPSSIVSYNELLKATDGISKANLIGTGGVSFVYKGMFDNNDDDSLVAVKVWHLQNQDMVAHVGGFGLARLLGTYSNQNIPTGVKGTIGYAPPVETCTIVGIKSLLNTVSITAALIDVNAAQSKLVLLENFNENYSKYLRLLYKVNVAEGVNAASEEVSTAELVSTAYLKEFDLLKWDQQVVSELVALRNFARRHGSRFYTHDYALWEVIENGATLPKTQVVEGVTTVMPITSSEDRLRED